MSLCVCQSALQEECEKFGSVKSVHIPRPSTTNEQEKPGVGFVFVAFDAVDSAAKAAASLRARTFDGRKVRRALWCFPICVSSRVFACVFSHHVFTEKCVQYLAEGRA